MGMGEPFAVENVPSPLPKRMLISGAAAYALATARSGMPSPLKSAETMSPRTPPKGKGEPAACASAKFASRIAIGKRSEEHTSELQSRLHLVCRLLLEKKKQHPSYSRLSPSGIT